MSENLLGNLKKLIFELVEIESDVAKLDVSDRMSSVRRVKRALLVHSKSTNDFKKEIDKVRLSIVNKKEKK